MLELKALKTDELRKKKLKSFARSIEEMQQQIIFFKQERNSLQILRKNDLHEKMIEEVKLGLSNKNQRYIPSTYFYDAEGSRLFEEITQLPEYYLTRKEAALLAEVAPKIIQQYNPQEIVELGSGASTKTRNFFEHENKVSRTYIPIDISYSILEQTIPSLIQDYPNLRVHGICGRYEDAIAFLPTEPNRLVLFLGSALGNFTLDTQSYFFLFLANCLLKGTYLLIGFDRQAHEKKNVQVIQNAYNDNQGMTANFNLNLLAHMNRELGANFDINAWKHKAFYNLDANQIEMHLECRNTQQIYFRDLGESYTFHSGEDIMTEISRKFDPDELADWFEHHGFKKIECWNDSEEYYSLLLLQRL